MSKRFLCPLLLGLLVCSAAHAADPTNELMKRPQTSEPSQTSGVAAIVTNPASAYDECCNSNSAAGLSATRIYTEGNGTSYARLTLGGFEGGLTPLTLNMRFDAYANGEGANCPARFKAEYFDGKWHTWFEHEDAGAGSFQIADDWTGAKAIPAATRSAIVKIRLSVEAEIKNGGCNLGGSSASLHVYDVQMQARTPTQPPARRPRRSPSSTTGRASSTR